ncbi:MAG: hypothetical protein LBQ64_06230 [Bacteroidales bacterium]|nr:hypothetical protein [Bacteroidales bacterium]
MFSCGCKYNSQQQQHDENHAHCRSGYKQSIFICFGIFFSACFVNRSIVDCIGSRFRHRSKFSCFQWFILHFAERNVRLLFAYIIAYAVD